MAKLLVRSENVDELREIVRRWLAEAPTTQIRRQYELFGEKLIEIKLALAEAPIQPTQEELEFQLTLMLQFAAQSGSRKTP